jgi:glutamate-ammonia-ligase adenylyltransferase
MNEELRIPPVLSDLADETKAHSLLQPLGFSELRAARATLLHLEARDPHGLEVIFPYLANALGSAADPDRSLLNFERLMDAYGLGLFSELEKNPRVIEILVTLFSASPFLTEILLRTPGSLDLLTRRQALTERKAIDQFQAEAMAAYLAAGSQPDKLDALRLYQRHQLLRIGTSDFLDLYDLRTVFSQLSRIAIGLIRACLALAVEQTGVAADDFSVLAVGKLGGWELNYSSDVDLLFVVKNNTEECHRLAKQLVENLASTTTEGFLYRVDLRLRPWGNDGPLTNTIDGYTQYMKDHARLWEKQAYLKTRVVAGNLAFGEELRREIEPYIFNVEQDKVRSSILAMKLRTEEYLREKGRYWGEVKLGEGSIRDIEFVVQSLQLIHQSIRTRATLKAIRLMLEDKLLTPSDGRILTDGYIFLRTTEHYLQMIDNRQTYTLPSDPTALNTLARRLGFEGAQAGELFVGRYERHCEAIRSVFMKYVGNASMEPVFPAASTPPEVVQHISRMDASYAATFSKEEIEQHARIAEKINAETLVIVDAKALEADRWQVTVIGYDYLGELSLICGLMFVYGMDILDSHVFTYEPLAAPATEAAAVNTAGPGSRSHGQPRFLRKDAASRRQAARQKIVDVFTVRSVRQESITLDLWNRYAEDLHALLIKLQAGQRREAQGDLAKRVGAQFLGVKESIGPLYPIDIDIDNETSERYTVLKIDTPDTVGFLYEFSNALALTHINIARMDVRSIGNRVKDTIYVNDDRGQKITSQEKQRELRAATVLIKHFTHLLPHSPNPQAALLHFREFLGQLFKRPNWPDELVKLERPEVLNALAQLLGISDFLWNDFLRMQYSNLFPIVRDVNELATPKAPRKLRRQLTTALAQSEDWREVLNSFKDREMFRIDMRHLLGYTREFWDFSAELTDLVELVIEEAFDRSSAEMQQRFGKPMLEDGRPCGKAIFALGKCGGRELGFASDIELMLVYKGNGTTTGPKVLSASEYFEELIQVFIQSIRARQEGIFHIDMQLRPYGKAGSLAVTLEAFQRYYDPHGPAWDYERQALVKLRPLMGDRGLIEQVCRLRDRYVYTGEPFDVTAMRAMRERQIRHLVTAGTFNAKYSPGGLVDLEYLIQALQINHGAKLPELRLTNIRLAMAALAKAGILSEADYTSLRKAHTFLRWLIDSLRVVRGNTKDVNIPPFESEEFAFLARRLKYGSDTARLRDELARYQLEVQELSQRLLAIP